MGDEGLKRFAICVDDTDDLTKRTSTGAVCGAIAQSLMTGTGAQIEYGITRHQLLLDPAVPYTSHNSSMCFVAKMAQKASTSAIVAEILKRASECLDNLCAQSADPGLCICPLPGNVSDDAAFAAQSGLTRYGKDAQTRVLVKGDAYRVAEAVEGLSLTEHGGTGDGVIGALAGVGLRLSGNDGRFRGAWNLSGVAATESGTVTSEGLRGWLERCGTTVVILDERFCRIADSDLMYAVPDAKVVLHDGIPTIIVKRDKTGIWCPLDKNGLERLTEDGEARGEARNGRGGGNGRGSGTGSGHGGSGDDEGCDREAAGQTTKKNKRRTCSQYVEDTDEEEHTSDPTLQLCGSCLYRRLTGGGFSCVREDLR